MARIYTGIEPLVGGTPLLALTRYGKAHHFTATVLAKLEYLNPAGSAKDRVGLSLILDAEERGLLKPGATIIEPTSGNTGIGLACIAAARGYKVILTMPDTMSAERRSMLGGLWCPARPHPAPRECRERWEKPRSWPPRSPAALSPASLKIQPIPVPTTRPPGRRSGVTPDGNVDIFVATVGTGGTLSGTGRYLKEQDPNIKVVAVEPDASPLLSGGQAGPHGIQGIGANFIPQTLDRSVYDQVIRVRDQDAFQAGRELVRTEGSAGRASPPAPPCGRRESWPDWRRTAGRPSWSSCPTLGTDISPPPCLQTDRELPASVAGCGELCLKGRIFSGNFCVRIIWLQWQKNRDTPNFEGGIP